MPAFGLYYALNDALDYRLDQVAPFNTVFAAKSLAFSSIAPDASYSGAKIVPSGVQPNLQTPTVESYTLKIEQQLSPSTTLSVGYIGSHGYHEILSIDANVPFPTICPASPCPAGYPAGTWYNPANAPLANSALTNSTHWFSEGVSSYNALQVDARRHFSHGFALRAVYTYSKVLDDGDSLNTSVATNSPAFAALPLLPRLDYGRGSFDIRHAAVINATYDLPFATRQVCSREPLGGAPHRKLAAQRNRDFAIRPAVHTTNVLQPCERRRQPQSGQALHGSELRRTAYPGRPRSLLQYGGLHPPARGHIRQRATQLLGGAGTRGNRPVPGEEDFAFGAVESAIQGRILQPAQPREPQHAESCCVHCGDGGPITDGRRDHVDLDQFAADSVGIETPLVRRNKGGATSKDIDKESDLYGTYDVNGRLQIGAGSGHLVAGPFLRQATPAGNSSYPYAIADYHL